MRVHERHGSTQTHKTDGPNMTDILREPVTEPCAWKATDFVGDDSWMHRLTAQDLGEIDDALAAVRRRGLRHFQFGKADFPLPTLGARIEQILQELEFGRSEEHTSELQSLMRISYAVFCL